ncbi:MAG: ACP S-malonyltransferase [Nitrospirae bacterium]|nr:ACP S-malonyltransferase [Nitrospirota bacterium]
MGGTFKEMTGAIFPGIGSERDGMKALIKEDLLKQIDISCGEDILLQQNIYAVSASLWDSSKLVYPISLVAGHSLGFYSSLYASNSIDFRTGLYLINAAHDAILKMTGSKTFGITAIIGIKWDIIENLCRKFNNVYIANINSATQVVISGPADSIDKIEKKVIKEGALKVQRLSIKYPVHTPFLKGIEEIMNKAVEKIEIKAPEIPIVDHTTSEILISPEQIKETLSCQLARKVVWLDVIKKMWQKGIRKFIEVGPGDILSKITKWIERDAEVKSLGI